jgi:mRNA interferase RelE/StbE
VKQVTYTRAALKVLRRMPANTAALIIAKVEEFAADPAALANNVIRMKGRQNRAVRLRVGDWRVIMDDGVVLAVLEIGPRGGIYD